MEQIFRKLDKQHGLKESLQELSRQILGLCSQAIACMHSAQLQKSDQLLSSAKTKLAKLGLKLRSHPEFRSLDQVQLAYQEYIQAKTLRYILARSKLPHLSRIDLNNPLAYLGGLLDLMGELRRVVLDRLRQGKILEAQQHFQLMEQIYHQLIPMAGHSFFPMLRPKLDLARNLLVRTREELTLGSLIAELKESSSRDLG